MSSSSATPIFVIGSINTDMVVKSENLPAPGQTVLGGEFFMAAGGKGANQAVAAARLGVQVSMVGNLGEDMFGDQALAQLQKEGVECCYVYRDPEQASGVALINVDSAGENQIVVAPGANATLGAVQLEAALTAMPKGSLVLLQLEIPLALVSQAIDIASFRQCRVILDPAPALSAGEGLTDDILREAFLVTPNQSEAEVLTGIEVLDVESAKAAAEALLARGIQNVAVTLGSDGVLFADGDTGDTRLISAPAVAAVDTTAAGDCFNGALAAALARGLSLPEALPSACIAAAFSVTRPGAQDSLPMEMDLQSFSESIQDKPAKN